MKLACMTLPYLKFSFERALEGISRAGYRYVVFGLPHEGKDVLDIDAPDEAIRLQNLFAKFDLVPVMMFGKKSFVPGQTVESAKKFMQIAKNLGVNEIITTGTWGYRKFPLEPLTEQEMEQKNLEFIKFYKKVAVIAEELDIIISLKPHTGNTATAVHLNHTLDQIGSTNIKVCYDPANVEYYEGITAHVDFAQIVHRTHSIVAKDHRGDKANIDFPVPGTGDVNFPHIFDALKQARFDGTVIVERIDGPIELEHIDQRIEKARIRLEQMLHDAGFILKE